MGAWGVQNYFFFCVFIYCLYLNDFVLFHRCWMCEAYKISKKRKKQQTKSRKLYCVICIFDWFDLNWSDKRKAAWILWMWRCCESRIISGISFLSSVNCMWLHFAVTSVIVSTNQSMWTINAASSNCWLIGRPSNTFPLFHDMGHLSKSNLSLRCHQRSHLMVDRVTNKKIHTYTQDAHHKMQIKMYLKVRIRYFNALHYIYIFFSFFFLAGKCILWPNFSKWISKHFSLCGCWNCANNFVQFLAKIEHNKTQTFFLCIELSKTLHR